MLTRSELPENPVALSVRDADGGHHTLVAERVRGGRVRLTCTCEAHHRQGWCAHQLDLLCTRYDAVVERSEDTEFRFEDIVMGTPLADVADEVDVALSDFRTALKGIDARPTGLNGDALRQVAELASTLADAALQLEASLGRFRRKLG